MDFQRLQDRISAWAIKKKSTTEGKINHLIEEIKDLKKNPYDIERQADVYILMMAISDDTTFTMDELAEAINAKQNINEARQWLEPDEQGVIRHVPEETKL